MNELNPSTIWWEFAPKRLIDLPRKIKAKLIRKSDAYYSKLISILAEEMKPRVYLEIGIFCCDTFNLVSPNSDLAIGVDISSNSERYIKGDNTLFILGNRNHVDEELMRREVLIDLAFIDGDHSKEEVIKDFAVVEKYLSPNGLIILHDTWPLDRNQSGVEFCHNSWEVPQILRNEYQNYSIVTLPIHPGMTFIQKNSAMPEWTNNLE